MCCEPWIDIGRQNIAWLSLNWILERSWVALSSIVCQSVSQSVRHRCHPTKSPLFPIYTGIQALCWLECCEKYKSFKLKIPQPDSERRHSPDFRTVFGIMIGPFSSCEIGKTWGTNKQVNKQTNKNWKFQFPQPDYRPRHSPDFRTVFGIMIGPFSSCEIGKTWGLRTWEKALYKMRKSEKTTFQ